MSSFVSRQAEQKFNLIAFQATGHLPKTAAKLVGDIVFPEYARVQARAALAWIKLGVAQV